jgi:hypothetical protein
VLIVFDLVKSFLIIETIHPFSLSIEDFTKSGLKLGVAKTLMQHIDQSKPRNLEQVCHVTANNLLVPASSSTESSAQKPRRDALAVAKVSDLVLKSDGR